MVANFALAALTVVTVMICKGCKTDRDPYMRYDGKASEFCSRLCARKWSAIQNKEEADLKRSRALKGKPGHRKGVPFLMKGNPLLRISVDQKIRAYHKNRSDLLPFEKRSLRRRREQVLEEQNSQCAICHLASWLGKSISFDYDHIDGDHYNNLRENVRMICPNCHRQTPTYGRKKSSLKSK